MLILNGDCPDDETYRRARRASETRGQALAGELVPQQGLSVVVEQLTNPTARRGGRDGLALRVEIGTARTMS
jgi:hypothetical protein